MQAHKRLKDVRDALWQAAIEMRDPDGVPVADPYEMPPEELVEVLLANRILTVSDAKKAREFLHLCEDPENCSDHAELSDAVDTDMARIVAEVRSFRGDGSRDMGALMHEGRPADEPAGGSH